jgi:hypothetical protein
MFDCSGVEEKKEKRDVGATCCLLLGDIGSWLCCRGSVF